MSDQTKNYEVVNEDEGIADGRMVLCAANSYDKKYYFNQKFANLPRSIQDDIHVISVLFTEDCGGIFMIAFDPDGEVVLVNRCEEEDITYDEVSAGLMIGQIRKNRSELLDCLTAYYRILILKEDAASVLDDLSIDTGFEL